MKDREPTLAIETEFTPQIENRIVDECQGCGSKDLSEILNLGNQPRPNIYRAKESVLKYGEVTVPLTVCVCSECSLVQLNIHMPSDALFPSHYAYVTPEAMRTDFKQRAEETLQMLGKKEGCIKVLEFGSNNGIGLDEYRKLGATVLGVDPAADPARQAQETGIETIVSPFNPQLASEIVAERGKMDIVTAANVMQHIPDLKGTIEAVQKTLAKDGIFSVEFPWLEDLYRNRDFDSIYPEHYYYFNLTAVQRLLNDHGLTIVDAKRLPDIHLGSIRVFAKHLNSSTTITTRAGQLMVSEQESGLSAEAKWDEFRSSMRDIIHHLRDHLYYAQQLGLNIVAHGSSAKFVVLTNLGHIGPQDIKYVADSTKAKHGKVTPGMGIPVVPEEVLLEDKVDIIVSGIRNFYSQNKAYYDLVKKNNPKARIMIPIPQIVYR